MENNRIEISNLINQYNRKILNFDCNIILDNLIDGKLGVIVYFTSLYEVDNKIIYANKIAELLESIFDNCNNNKSDNIYLNDTLFYGISGLGLVISTLVDLGVMEENDFKEELETINKITFDRTQKMILDNNFGFFYGAIGGLYYLISVGEVKKVNQIIDLLFERCKSDQYLFYTRINDTYSDGMNFGLNHGYLSVIKTLLEYAKTNSKTLHIIECCIKNIISNLDNQYMVEGVHIYKPYGITIEKNTLKKHQNNRLCWCNSDLSFSYLLLKVGKLLNNDIYIELAIKIAKETTKRNILETTGIENYIFCHGSSGVMQLYHELYALYPNDLFMKAKKYWMNKTIAYLEADKDKLFESRDLSLLNGKLGALMVINNEINTRTHLKFLI